MLKVINSGKISTWAPGEVETRQSCVVSIAECQLECTLDKSPSLRLLKVISSLKISFWAKYSPRFGESITFNIQVLTTPSIIVISLSHSHTCVQHLWEYNFG